MTDETNEIAEMIYGEMASSASVDGVTFDDEQRGFIVQALSDAALEMRRRSASSVGQQESETVSLPREVAVRLDSLLSALLHHHTSLEKPVERAEADLLITAVRYAYEHASSVAAAPASSSVIAFLRARIEWYRGEAIHVDATDVCADAAADLSLALQQMTPAAAPAWRAIDEHTPKDEEIVLIGDGMRLIGKWGDYCVYNAPRFTRWMRLPPRSGPPLAALPDRVATVSPLPRSPRGVRRRHEA